MFCERLKEERERLGLSQTSFAESCGVKKNAQFKYEQGTRRPDSDYLEKALRLGVDVQYLLSGQRSSLATTPIEEQFLLESFRKFSVQEKRMFLGILMGGLSSTGSGVFNSPNAIIQDSFNK